VVADEIKGKGRTDMKFSNRLIPTVVFALAMVVPNPARAQTETQKTEGKTAASPESETQKENMQAYVDLLRRDVRQQKAEMMGAVMVLNAQDAAKFWPIYSEYDAQLTKLNDQRVENIKEYARSYNQMTDEKADELVQKSLAYQKERAELLAQTYNKVKQALGAITAARFAQVEHQLLLIIDLQIDSSLPVVG
jgi:flagellar biosynthesis/type III secretory pathway protein FliH